MADLNQVQLPNGGTYNFKDTTQTRSDHRHYETDLTPTISKVYTSTSYYSTNNSWDNSTWYFMSVKPDTYYKPWKVKFRVHSFCPSYSNVESVTWASLSGRADSFTYANFNENYDRAHYYAIAYPIKQAGLTAGYGHAIGISIRYGANYLNSAYYRTFEVDYYSCENCTVTILDTPVKWADWPGNTSTNYGSLVSMDAASRGLQESSDSDTLENRITYFSGKTGAKGVWAYSLFMEDAFGTYQNICTATDGTVTANNRTVGTKIANTNGFRVGGPIYYCNSDYNANTNITGWGNVYKTMSAFDSRYSLNTTLMANCLTPYTQIYLVGTINANDGLFYLDSTWWTQTPTTTGKVYILLGACYDSTTSNCRVTLYEQNKWYKYDGSRLVEFVDNSLTVNGYSVSKSVPSNAVFTDTTYTLGTSGNNVTLTPTGGTAQSITVPYATSAGSATKATQDESGNNIKATYANSFSISDHTITLKNKNGGSLGTVTVPDNNTTYTFANGTNGFTVTPSGGSAQTVTVTPSISNNVTGSGTSGYLTKFNGANTITNGPAIGSGTTKFLREDGSWQTPAYPTVNNGTLTLQKNGSNVATFTANQSGNTTANFAIHEEDITPLNHKTYASTSYYASVADWENSTWYFMSVKPDSWYKPWTVRFKVHSFCPSYSSYESITYATISGRSDNYVYANWNERQNSAHQYTVIYPLKQAGFNAGYGHAIGISVLYADNYTNSAYYRTFEIDYFYCENCTVTLLDTPVKWSSWAGTGSTNYGSLSNMNATSRGLQESGDSDTTYILRRYYNSIKAGANKIFPYTLIMPLPDGRWESIVTSNSTGTSKSRNPHGFRLGQIMYMSANSTYNENVVVGNNNVADAWGDLFDHRYSFNTANNSTNGLTANKPVYLVGTVNASDGLFYLDSTWWTQTLPSTADGKLYIYLGDAYDYYRMNLVVNKVIYRYVNGMIRVYGQDAGTVNGFTVEKSVPSNAVFTDNNTTYTFANGTNGFTVTPSGGSAQTVTVTPSISNNVTGSGTSGYLTKFNGTNTITNGPALGSSTTTFLRNDGQWATPATGSDVNVTQTATSTSANYEVLFSATADNTTRTEGARKNNNLTFNPSTGNLQATQLNGVNIGSSPKFTDNNTTYTFANGTNGFTVTPSGGSAQTVTVTPSIANNVTGSGTSGYLTKFNGGNTITNGPQLGSDTTKFLRNDGTWAVPSSSGSSGNKIFITEPTPPYSVGDLWLIEDNNISVCVTARASGSFVEDDWGSAVGTLSEEELQSTIASAIAGAVTVVTGNSESGGNVIWRMNSNNVPYELLVTDTPDNITASTARIYRWDANGLRYSSTGYNGTYTTLINSSGQIPAQYLTGAINAGLVAIQNFTASMIHGGVLSRGRANNQDGTIELYDANGTLIAEVTNLGFKYYGPGTGSDRPYYLINTNGFVGYTKVDNVWTQTVKVAFDEFRMIKGYVRDELDIGSMIKIIPMTSGNNSGIAFVAST